MGASVWKWWSGALLLVAAGWPGVRYASSQEKPVERYATRQGNVIQLHPSEVTLEVPEAWRGRKLTMMLSLTHLRE
jgi:hypothetical protein